MTRLKSPWRSDFAFFTADQGKASAAYLDSAASSQMLTSIAQAMHVFDSQERVNVHRGVYPLSEQATLRYEAARKQVAEFLAAESSDCIAFTHGCTEGLNLVCESFLRPRVQAGDEIIVTEMEHHANLVPWLAMAKQLNLKVKVVPVDDMGVLDLDVLAHMISERTQLITVTHISNVLGTVNPIQKIAQLAQSQQVPLCVDGAQAAAHGSIDVQALGVDFYVLSGHKMFASYGVGAVYVAQKHWAQMQPYQKGGGMISQVSFDEVVYAPMPTCLEAGTPNISGAIALGMACAYMQSLDWQAVMAYQQQLNQALHQLLEDFSWVRVIGQAVDKAPIASFVTDTVHAHDMATVLGSAGVCVRAGHHCAMPLMKRYGVLATTRASCLLYNDQSDLDALSKALQRVEALFYG